MDKRPISELMETTMQKIRDMVDANTIVGSPVTTPDGILLLPVSKLSFAFAGGGSDFTKKQEPNNALFGGGCGAGVKIEPVAFVVVNGDNIKLLHVAPEATSTIDKVIEAVPGVVDKITEFIKERKEEKEGDE